MDAIKMLEADHAEAKKVMDQIAKAQGSKRKELFDALKAAIETHDKIEEAIFYPAVLAHPKTAAFPAADRSAHEQVEAALERLGKESVEDESWMKQFKAMQTSLLKHVADEETNIFPKVRATLSHDELNELGVKLKAEKEFRLKGPVRA